MTWKKAVEKVSKKVSDYAIQRGGQIIAKCVVKDKTLYVLWDGETRVNHYDSPKAAREAADKIIGDKKE
jgi:hypothetical protein